MMMVMVENDKPHQGAYVDEREGSNGHLEDYRDFVKVKLFVKVLYFLVNIWLVVQIWFWYDHCYSVHDHDDYQGKPLIKVKVKSEVKLHSGKKT